MISVTEIEQRLRQDCEALARRLLPNCRRDGQYLRIGSVAGEPGDSMAIYLAGDKRGKWEDFAGNDHGDMLDLIQICERLTTKRDAVAWAKRWLGIEDRFQPQVQRPSEEERREAAAMRARLLAAQQAREAQQRESRIKGAKALYLGAKSVAISGTPAEGYLRNRMLEPVAVGGDDAPSWPNSLRFHPEVWCKAEGTKLPAMLAPIYLPDGTFVAVHRTYLQHDPRRRGWIKLASPDAKKVLGPMGGGFVPINKGASGKSMRHMKPEEWIYMTEGIEDALTVRLKRPEARIICGVTLGNMGTIVMPRCLGQLVLVCDRDTNEKAQAALERVIARQQARGVKVGIVMPPPGIKDMNEWLASEKSSGAA